MYFLGKHPYYAQNIYEKILINRLKYDQIDKIDRQAKKILGENWPFDADYTICFEERSDDTQVFNQLRAPKFNTYFKKQLKEISKEKVKLVKFTKDGQIKTTKALTTYWNKL